MAKAKIGRLPDVPVGKAKEPEFYKADVVSEADILRAKPPVELERARRLRLRDEKFTRDINEAATLQESQWKRITPLEGEKIATLRIAFQKVFDKQPRALEWGVRGGAILVGKRPIPGGRGRPKA